jgi:hypothetical protein
VSIYHVTETVSHPYLRVSERYQFIGPAVKVAWQCQAIHLSNSPRTFLNEKSESRSPPDLVWPYLLFATMQRCK